MLPRTIIALFFLVLPVAAYGAPSGEAESDNSDRSLLTTRPVDAKAPTFDPRWGDASRDSTAALQAAIDDLQRTRHQGILYIPEGRYRLSGTIHVWTGIRLIGFGLKRPVFFLPGHTPGFSGPSSQYLFHFVHERPAPGAPLQDGTSETFYSGMFNLDVEVGEGNPSAVAIRFHVAQHGILSHLRMQMGSAHAALQDVGNVANDLHIIGGEYAIDTGQTAPGWQFVLMDSVLEQQRTAAIKTHDAGMTLARVIIRQAPVGIEIPAGQVEQLSLTDSSFDTISDTAIKPGDIRNVRPQIAADHIACHHVPRFLATQSPAAQIASTNPVYTVERMRLGLRVGPDGRDAGLRFDHTEHPGAAPQPPSDVPPLPPVSTWANIKDLGAVGDGLHDDTQAIQHAIASHATLFFPAGRYRLTGTLQLRPETALIGLHPFATQFVLADNTPEFAGDGPTIPLIETPVNSTNLITGIGISTGTINPRAGGMLWHGGTASMIEDVKFFGGRGTLGEDGKPLRVYPEVAGADLAAAWNTQRPSLIVRNGGGIFRAIWSASAFAQAGLVIEDAHLPGRIYGFSCEHHLLHETQIRRASNWRILALQTEEEKLEGKDAVALTLEDTHAITFGNLFLYRVSRSLGPAHHAIAVSGETGVEFENVHVFAGGRYAFDHSITDERSHVSTRIRDFNSLELAAPSPRARRRPRQPSSPRQA